MIKGTSKSNTYLHNRKLMQQVKDNRLDAITWQTQKEYPYIQGMKLTTIWQYVESGRDSVKPYGLYLYDFDQMIERYQNEVAEIPNQIIKDKHSLGPITHLLVYSTKDIDSVWSYFNENKKPLMLEYISLNDFICAIMGDEDFYKVRSRWYKRLERVYAKTDAEIKRKVDPDLTGVTIDKKLDEANSNKKNSAYFYSLKDLLHVDDLYRDAERRKEAKKKK